MTKNQFLKEFRNDITSLIARAYGDNAKPTNDKERWDWVMNDEGLYNLARINGVNV